MDLLDMNNAVVNVYNEYHRLEASVRQVLKASAGDAVRLTRQTNAVANFEKTFDMHKHLFDDHNRLMIPKNLARFKADLSAARVLSADPPDYPAPAKAVEPGADTVKRSGRPQIYMNPKVLECLVHAGYKAAKIAKRMSWPVRTVMRRLISLGLVLPGVAPIQRTLNPDGTTTQTHHPTRPLMSSLTNEQLDFAMLNILDDHPFIGRKMLKASLELEGHRVSDRRIRKSYLRVHGPSNRPWNQRSIVRQTYSVPGANSVWHMDGNHLLIQYKIILHLFVDGASRVAVGIGAHGNNLSLTVLHLFLSTHREWGIPTHIRGDHGVENVKVAWWMQIYRGLGVSAYIWGKSTHNTRVERMWNDTGNGFMNKWKIFFLDLEANHRLNPQREVHIWLLHHLFLNSINADAQQWKRIWNAHKMNLDGRPSASPQELWMESQLRDGVRGFNPQLTLPVLAPEWEQASDDSLDDVVTARAESGLFEKPPGRLSYVRCEPSGVTWTQASILAFDRALDLERRLQDTTMPNRREIWIDALIALPLLEA